jgi:hypothetical protein
MVMHQMMRINISNRTVAILAMGGNTSAWEGISSDDEVFAINLWLSSLWPDDVYNAWS